MLNLYFSNRHEHLAATLLQQLQHDPASVFEPITIVVPNVATGSWLTLKLADINGICSQVDFPLPGRFFWQLFHRLVADGERRFLDSGELVWRLFEWLRQHRDDRDFAAIHRYLQQADELRCHELATVLAHQFDQYLVYRPDWIGHWERGQAEHWQASLWRSLMQDSDLTHWVDSREQITAALAQPQADPAIPERLYLYGLSALSPAYIDILQHLSRVCEVHLFVLNPSRESWSELNPSLPDLSDRDCYVDTHQPLLSAFGRKGRDFIDALMDCEAQQFESVVEVEHTTLLSKLHTDMLELRAPDRPVPIAADDCSVCINICHGPIREVEVLHDHLLQCFEQRPDLRPEDILVMLPDVDTYATAIDAVFGSRRGSLYIPYSVADRSPEMSSETVRHFIELLSVFESRFGLNEVLALLQSRDIRQRYEIQASDLPIIHHWLEQASIRWGIDAEFRTASDVPDEASHTWRWGLQRLLLGAATGSGDIEIAGCLAADTVDGSQAPLLGHLVSFCEALFHWQAVMQQPALPQEWRQRLLLVLQTFFRDGDELSSIREVVDGLEQELLDASPAAPISLAVIKAALSDLLRRSVSGGQYTRGGVQFCRLQCERAVPVQIMVLLGLNDGALHGRETGAGLNLMLQRPRKGDRSRRSDERYAFLEAILAAREQLYLSYTGRDCQRDTQLQPASVLSEFVDIIDSSYQAESGGSLSTQLQTVHPPSAFSLRYYGPDAGLYSYNDLFQQQDCELRAFVSTDDRESSQQTDSSSEQLYALEHVLQCLRHPTRYYLQQRLGLDLYEYSADLQDEEPFVLAAADCRRLQSRWLPRLLAGASLEQELRHSQLRGDLPHGQVGSLLGQQAAEELERLLERMRRAGFTERAHSRMLTAQVDRWRIKGRISDLWPRGRCVLQPGDKIFHGHWTDLWLNHLLLQQDELPEQARTSVIISTGKVWQLPALEPDRLAGLWSALLPLVDRAALAPLPLLPRSAWAYAEKIGDGKSHDEALRQAGRQWHGDSGGYSSAECEDPWHWQVYQGADVLDQDFCELALQVYLPIIELRQELKHV